MPNWLEQWLRKHPFGGVLAGALSALIVVDGLAGGFSVLKSAYRWVNPEPVASVADPVLRLVNLSGGGAIDAQGPPRSDGVNLVIIEADFTNPGPIPLVATVSSVEVDIEGSECARDEVAWNALPMGQGITTNAILCNLRTSVEPGQVAAGRISVVVKYGRSEQALDRVLLIKGQILVRGSDGRLAWVPDADSAKPVGMSPSLAIVPADEGASDALREEFGSAE